MSNTDSTHQMLKRMTSPGLKITDLNDSSNKQVVVGGYGEKKLQLAPTPSMVDLLNSCLNSNKQHESTPT